MLFINARFIHARSIYWMMEMGMVFVCGDAVEDV